MIHYGCAVVHSMAVFKALAYNLAAWRVARTLYYQSWSYMWYTWGLLHTMYIKKNIETFIILGILQISSPIFLWLVIEDQIIQIRHYNTLF